MQIQVSARHGHLSEAHQTAVREKVGRLTRYHEKISAITAIADIQDPKAVRVDLHVVAEHAPEFVSHDTSDELMRALDGAMAKMEQQLRKHNEKIHEPRVKKVVVEPTDDADE